MVSSQSLNSPIRNRSSFANLDKRASFHIPSSATYFKSKPLNFSVDKNRSVIFGSDVDIEDYSQNLSSFMKNLMDHLIDEVCIYTEKTAYLETCLGYIEFKSEEEKKNRLEMEKKNISRRSITFSEENEEQYHKIIPVFIKNEKGFDNGKYGWFSLFKIPFFLLKF